MRFTVVVPTFNNGDLIRPAIESVLTQTLQDFELVVVADGAPATTHAIVEEYARRDRRVTLRAYEKGPRHGEVYRHEAIANATTEAVGYLSDDDFWFPEHLETLARLLADSDFAHTRQLSVLPSLHLEALEGDLADPAIRTALLETTFNFIGLSVVGHRLDAYRRLSEGWASAPPDVWTDLNMWRKWISAPGMRLRTGPVPTSLHMARGLRTNIDPACLAQESRLWYAVFSDQGMRQALRRVCPPTQEHFPVSLVFKAAGRLRLQERHETAERLSDLSLQLEAVSSALRDSENALSASMSVLHDREEALAGSIVAARRAAEALDIARMEIRSVRTSTSWRLTEPLRRLVMWLRGLDPPPSER